MDAGRSMVGILPKGCLFQMSVSMLCCVYIPQCIQPDSMNDKSSLFNILGFENEMPVRPLK